MQLSIKDLNISQNKLYFRIHQLASFKMMYYFSAFYEFGSHQDIKRGYSAKLCMSVLRTFVIGTQINGVCVCVCVCVMGVGV